MLFYIGSFIINAAVSAILADRMDVVYPSVETARSGEKIIKFRALDKYINLRLEPAGDVISDKFIMMNGANEKINHSINIENFKRKFYKNRKTDSALYIDDEGPTIINGIINSNLKIEPYQLEKLKKGGRIAHRVSEIPKSDSVYVIDKIIRPVLKDDLKERSRQLTNNDCLKIEVVLILDSNMTERYKTHLELASYLTNTVVRVQIMFDSLMLGMRIELFGIIKLTKENEETEAPYLRNRGIYKYREYIDAGNLLRKMAEYYCSQRFLLIEQADVVLLISGRIFVTKIKYGTYGKTFKGKAYFGKVCQQCFKYGIIEDDLGDLDDTIVTIAHEMGHMLGAYHDGESPDAEACSPEDNYIMKNIYNEDVFPRNFSRCSRESIQKTLTSKEASCIIEKCQE